MQTTTASGSTSLFKDVHFYLSHSLPPEQRDQLRHMLTMNDAHDTKHDSPTLTHYITNSPPDPDSLEYTAERDGLHFVTPAWVERSVVLGARQEPNYYSPHPAMLFSGVVATSSELSASDNEVIAAGIASLGGQWRTALTKDITHVFALTSGSAKYETAMHFREATHMKVLVPHWFDDVVRLGCRSLPTEQYEWPDPQIFRAYGVEAAKAVGANTPDAADTESRRSKPPSPEKRLLYDTALSSSSDLPPQRPASDDLWHGLKIMFGSSLNFKASQLEAHIADVERAGGEVVSYNLAEEELEKVEQADVYIARHRSGPVFVKAYKLNKTIGTLSWFWYVRATGTLTRPADQLLHYPTPKRPIEGFSRHIITVTNYTGKDREYLKKLMSAMGAEFTPTMSGKNTVVIAAYHSGAKIAKAQSWGIPIVNHLWLEDCYAQWRDISPALDRYINFPPGMDFGALLAEDGGRAGAGLVGGVMKRGRKGYDQAELDRMEKEVEEELQGGQANKENVVTVAESPKRGILKKTARPLPAILSQSTKDAREVEDAVSKARPPVAKPRRDDEDTSIADVTRAYVDMDVPLDNDGRLSDADIIPADDAMDVDKPPETPKRGRGRPRGSGSKWRSATPTRKSPRTPSPGRASAPRTPQTKSAARSSKPVVIPDDAEDEEMDEPSPVRPKKKLVKRFSTGDVASDADERRVGRPTTRVTKGKNTERAGDDSALFAEGSSKKGTVIKTYGARSRSRSRSRVRRDDEEQVEEDEEPSRPRSRGRPRSSTSGKGKEKVVDEDEEMDDVELEPPAKRKPGRPRKDQATSKEPASRKKPVVPIDIESEDEGPVAPKKREVGRKHSRGPVGDDTDEEVELTASPARARTPRRQASVLVPTLAEVQSSSQPAADKKTASPERKKAASKADAEGTESLQKSPAKRGRPAKSKAKSPSPSRSPSPAPAPKPRGRPPKAAKAKSPTRTPSPAKPAAKAKPRRSMVPPPPPESGRSSVEETPTRRNAAAKAAQRLHDEIMPDANNFAKELKSGHVKSGYEEQINAAAKEKEKGKKRASLDNEDEGEEQDAKKRKTDAGAVPVSKRGRPRKSAEGEEDAKAAKGAVAKTDGRKIVVMTTQVVLSEDTTRAFQKLGAKFTTKPAECTHLVVRAIVRTEKFLCAIARAPYVLTERWVEASVAKKTILPEDDFKLEDHANEKKWGCNLAATLQRAKATGGKIFAGKTFYITPKVSVDHKLLRNVLAAGGGQFSAQTPTVRSVKGNESRVVVSCAADVSIWRPLAEAGHPVYTHELILSSMLNQEVEWEKHRVAAAK